jgi:outer membrane protein W
MKSMNRLKFFTIAGLAWAALTASIDQAFAFVELGANANYRRSAFDSNNFQELISYTGSISYYFMEMSALELSYTNGYSEISAKSSTPSDPQYVNQTNFQLLALDLVVSFAEREDFFQPYVKIGAGYLKKDDFEQVGNGDNQLIAHSEGMVPSGGLGFRLMMTKSFAIKFGVDAWTTPLHEDPVVVDFAGYAGVSWLF